MRRLVDYANASDRKMLDVAKVTLKKPVVLGWPPIDKDPRSLPFARFESYSVDEHEENDYVREDDVCSTMLNSCWLLLPIRVHVGVYGFILVHEWPPWARVPDPGTRTGDPLWYAYQIHLVQSACPKLEVRTES